jgi:hypothetical protein
MVLLGLQSLAGNLNTARANGLAGRWNSNSSIMLLEVLLLPTTGATEEYDGSYLDNSDHLHGLNTAREALAGAGIQTAALAFGGGPSVTGATEEYDGSTWTTSPGSLGTARYALGEAGTQTAGLGFGGYTGTANTAATEEFTGAGAAVTKTITVS